MTFQPPPPPPGGNPPPPPPPPPGQWGPPPGGGYPQQRPGFDPKTVNPLDWGILGLGFLLFIFSFFDYYSWDYGFGSITFSAWHTSGGTWVAWLAMAIGVIAALVVAVALFMPTVNLPMGARLLSLGLFALSFLLYIIAIFAHSDFGPGGGHGFSFWISLIFAAGGVVLSLMRAQQTGTQLPGALANLPNIGARGPQGGIGGGPTPPPPAGYGPPPQ